jgi:hypothetical protein
LRRSSKANGISPNESNRLLVFAPLVLAPLVLAPLALAPLVKMTFLPKNRLFVFAPLALAPLVKSKWCFSQ